ncbi:hypothetical protein PQX77_010316 [Marasmius sp. AFHP31]|nr:hypothetical protein PQX77_010316 [Marasmius sp. AFHP31]
MIPHLRNVLSTVPLHLVMPAVFDQWFFLPGRKWTVGDIETALAPDLSQWGIEDHLIYAKRQFLTQDRGTRLFNRLLHWIHVSTDGGRESQDLFPIPFRSIDANPDDDTSEGLWNTYMKIAQDPAVPDYYWETMMEDLAPYIIASSPDYALHLPTAKTSPFVKSADGCEFLSKIHSTIFERELFENWFSQDRGMDWMEAMDIVRRVHDFPENHFKPFPGHFPLPLTKLKKTLNSLSPTDPGNDFQYLDGFSRGWGDANEWNKRELVRILSKHINSYSKSDAEQSHSPGEPRISPIVMSSAGFELITFVNNRLAMDSDIFVSLLRSARRRYETQWRCAIEWVKVARPELPLDYFQDISHGGVDNPVPDRLRLQQEVEVEAQAGDSGDGPRDVTNAGDVNRDEMDGRSSKSAAELSPRPEPGELDERRPNPLGDGETNEKGSTSRQPIVTRDSATGSGDTNRVVQGEKMVGGPDADKNV